MSIERPVAALIMLFGPFLFTYLGNRIGRTTAYRTEHWAILLLIPIPAFGIASVLISALYSPWELELGDLPERRWFILVSWCLLWGLIGALSALNKRIKQQYTIEFVASQDQELQGHLYERGDIMEVAYFESQRRQNRAAKMLSRYRDSDERHLDLSDWPELNWRIPSTDDWMLHLGLINEGERFRMYVQERDIKALSDTLEFAAESREYITMFFHDPVKWENWFMRRSGKGRRAN